MRPSRARKRPSLQAEIQSESGSSRRPTRAELLAAVDKTVPDIIAHGLKILFCGINPGLYSAWAGHHFARPGNRFWPALHAGEITERLLRPDEEDELLKFGYGITNLVHRATVGSQELTREELRAGGQAFIRKVRKYRPATVAILGVSAHRLAFDCPGAAVGRQPERMGGALVWILPNPSGLNAHFTPSSLAKLFREFRRDVFRENC